MGGGFKRGKGLNNFLPEKGGLLERVGGRYLRGGKGGA